LNPIAFDTLKYANRLKQAGFSSEQAEAGADALAGALEAHQAELSTKADIAAATGALKSDIAAVRSALTSDIAAVRSELAAVRSELSSNIAAVRSELTSDIAAVKADLAAMDARHTAALEKMGQTLFIRLGSLMTVLIGLLAIISRMPR
jgi:hypothetical protein